MSEFVIRTKNVTKKFLENVSVSNLSMNVRKGVIYGLLGRNGAGKSTTMKMLLGLTMSDGTLWEVQTALCFR